MVRWKTGIYKRIRSLLNFSFNQNDLDALSEALQIPEVFKCKQRSRIDGMEELCMILKRFAYPCRYSDMVHRFGRPVPVLSMAANAVTNYVFDTHGHLITDWNPNILHRQALFSTHRPSE